MTVETVDLRADDVLTRVRHALDAMGTGRPVVLVDSRTGEGDLIFAAEFATSALLAFAVRHSSGYVCVALTARECHRLQLPPMQHTDATAPQQCVAVDAATGVHTGISAADRARTIVTLADPNSNAADFNRPGHVIPMQTHDDGVLGRQEPPEAAIDLTWLAGAHPAAARCEIVSRERPAEIANGLELERFAAEHEIALVSLADLVTYRKRTERQHERTITTEISTEHGQFRMVGYRNRYECMGHIALIAGNPTSSDRVPVHLHSECVPGAIFGAMTCQCGQQLTESLAALSSQQCGVLIYLRPAAPLGAHGSPDMAGAEAGEIAADLLRDLGVSSIQLRRSNECDRNTLRDYGLCVQ